MKSNRLIPFQTWRLTFFQAVIFAVFLIFCLRMYELQVVQFADFQGEADENRFSGLPIAARRGAIFDRNDRRLAFNVPAFNVTIIPAQLPDDEEIELEYSTACLPWSASRPRVKSPRKRVALRAALKK